MRALQFRIRATQETDAAFNEVNRNMRNVDRAGKSWNRGLNANRRAVQQFGFQMSDFAVQVAGGQSAMLAFTQQGGQMLQFFGPAGSIAAAFLAVFGSLTIAFTRGGGALEDMLPALGAVRDDFEAITAALGVVKEALIDFANILINNLDRIIAYSTILAGAWAVRIVGAFVAARVAALTLTGVLTTLAAVMLRILPIAVLVGLAEVYIRMKRLTEAAGSVGSAFGMLADVFREVVTRIGRHMRRIPLMMKTAANAMAGFFIRQLQNMVGAFSSFTTSIADGFNSLFGTNLQGGIGSELFNGLDDLATGYETAADAAQVAAETLTELNKGPLRSVQAIRDALADLDSTGKDIDIRDWFGGGDVDVDGGSGSKSPAEKISEEAKKIKAVFDDLSSTISNSMQSAFKSLFDGSKSFTEAATDMLTNMLWKLTEVLLSPVWDGIAQKLSQILIGSPGTNGSLGGGLLSNILGGLLNFDGGGYTGRGSRVGGLDGKGGMLAMVHPNETVTDHEKMISRPVSAAAPGAMSMQVHIHENARDDRHEVTQDGQRVDVYLKRAVSEMIATGGTDKAFKSRFGVSPRPIGS